MTELRFEGKVAIVTGSGRNLGREYALLLASRGARVVVNDFGVAISDTDGSGEAPPPTRADDVVREIADAGGEAVANHDSVATAEGGRAIVQTALDEFGRVDVVVNNAGQVRMAPFAEFSDDLTDTVIDTQLRGVLNVSRPAWKAMTESGASGRFVNVSSGAAFGGVPDGSVYSMAKMGVVGLTARDGVGGPRAAGIAANVISPSAKTRPGTGFGPFPWSPELAEWLLLGWWRPSSGGWPTTRARSRGSGSPWAAGTWRASVSPSPRATSTATPPSTRSPRTSTRSWRAPRAHSAVAAARCRR